MAIDQETIRRITIQARADVDGAVASLKTLASAQDGVAKTSEQTTRANLSVEKSYEGLQRRVDTTHRAQVAFEKDVRTLTQAQAQGLVPQERLNELLTLSSQRYNQTVAAAGAAGKATQTFGQQTGLARHELINLSRQAQDVVVSLGSGQGLGTVLLQQGTQIADVFASSGGTVRGFFSQAAGWAGTFLKSTGGIVTSVLAIGGAAIFAASQFARASTTIEQALEEQNRLLKEGKALLDARTSAEARAQLQSKEQTQFEARRNELDLQVKLNAAMEEAARLAASRAGTPTGGGVPEMGIAPTGIAARSDPGYEKIIEAHAKLKGAQEAGLPGIKEFNAELAKVGLAHPELALIVQDMLKAGEAGLELEKSALRAKALSAALGDVATNAQLAALGLGSIAQIQLNNQQANEAREATERQAIAILKIRDNWGGVSIEAAKTLDALSRQLDIAQAVGAMAQIEAQHKAKIAELSERMSASEATRIADLERAISLAQIEYQHKQTMVALQGQLSVAKQVTEVGQINAQYAATVQLLTLQVGQVKAIEQAEAQRAISIAQANASAEQQLKTLQQQGQLLQASSDFDRDRIAAAQTYRNLLEKNVDSDKARAVAGQQLRNADISRQAQETADAEREAATETERRARAANDAANAEARAAEELDRIIAAAREWARIHAFIPGFIQSSELFTRPDGTKSQFNPQGYDFKTDTPQLAFAKQAFGTGGFTWQDQQQWGPYAARVTPNAQGYEFQTDRYLGGRDSQGISGGIEQLLNRRGGFDVGGFGPRMLDQAMAQTLGRLTNLLPDDQKSGVIQRELALLQEQPQTIARDELIKQLTDQLKQLEDATKANTDALNARLDPLFSEGHDYINKLRIGYYQNAEGGIMTKFGKIPLRHYDQGGITTRPSVFTTSENYKPEAIIPLKNGAVPVLNLNPSTNAGNDNRRSVSHQYFGPGSIVVNQRSDASRLSLGQMARGFRPLVA